ncbi:MFS transporter [Pandoraea pneumonica]|uniref:MFS transporter n=1 Tax=Pandoraea pneumonica TaxID=2508299 RepID=UPI003CF6AE62
MSSTPGNHATTGSGAISRKDARTLFLTSLGGALEYYDFIVAVFFTKLLVTVFFPPEMPGWLAELQVFCIFAAGYLVRPIGGVFFAHFGDKIGRKQMFALTLFLMAAPTLLIGLLPTYHAIGLAAPLLFLFCRVLQGLSVGGEVPGAWIFCAEHVRSGRAGLACGILMSGLCSGMLLGSLSAKFLFVYFDTATLESWAWRLPFILGGVFGLISVYLRRYLRETPVFEAIRARREADSRPPLAVVLADHRRSILMSVLLTWVYSGIFVLYFLYTPTFIQSHFGISATQAFSYNSWSILLLIIGATFMGWLADRIGVGRAYVMGCIAMLIVSVAFFYSLITGGSSTWSIYVIGGFFIATISLGPYMIIQSFPPQVRFTGFALSYNTAYAIFGGTAPALMALFAAENMLMAPAWYIAALCVLGVILGIVWRARATVGSTATSELSVGAVT